MAEIKDKVTLLIEETNCDRSEAELALELCGYDLEKAVKAIPRLFQNIVVLKARVRAVDESLYGLLLVILNVKEKSLLRARAVVSYNPAVYASELEQHWFDYEARLYACRLWVGTLQDLSQEIEQLLSAYFASTEAKSFYQEGRDLQRSDFDVLRGALAAKLGGQVDLKFHQDVLDLGQFREVRPDAASSGAEQKSAKRDQAVAQRGGAPLVLQIEFERGGEDGITAKSLSAGDLIYTRITDSRDIAQYLGKLFGSRTEEGVAPLLVPVEAIEKDESGRVMIRVRFSAGVCGDLSVAQEDRLKAVARPSNMPWWKKIFGRA